jgi:hypothetical protein
MSSGNELVRRASQHNRMLPTDGRTRKEVVNLFRETGIAALKVDAIEHIELKAMNSISDVIDYARELAGNDPIKAEMFIQRIRNYSRKLDRAQGIFGG